MNAQAVEAMDMNYNTGLFGEEYSYTNEDDNNVEEVTQDDRCSNCGLDCKDYCHRQGGLFDDID